MSKLNIGDYITVTVIDVGDILLCQDNTGKMSYMMADENMDLDKLYVGCKITYQVIEVSDSMYSINNLGEKEPAFGLKYVGMNVTV